jgi:hypothetical protein
MTLEKDFSLATTINRNPCHITCGVVAFSRARLQTILAKKDNQDAYVWGSWEQSGNIDGVLFCL